MRKHVLHLGPALAALLLAACGGNSAAPPDMTLVIDCAAHPELSPKECGYCLGDSWCVQNDSMNPRCEPNTHKCVKCLPASQAGTDNCGQGQVCQFSGGQYKCSMTCSVNAECIKIMGDGFFCCAGGCVKLDSDISNCGACGTVCGQVNNGQPGCNTGHCIIGKCNTGFDDCDKQPENGCEVATGTDPQNCGMCGMACKPFANGIPMCANSVCSASCAPGYAHCSQNPNDGCEVDTTGDTSNCGACGKTCTAPANATTACDLGKCSFRCKPGFADCNGDAKDGCEVTVTGDVNNCGHCGNICPLRPQANAATCTNGLCGNSCNQGYGDCDGNVNNGCEANLNIDLNNCGSCGFPCTDAHGKCTCGMGVCSKVCDKGYQLCNGVGPKGSDLCVNVQTDPKNCGACGNVCPQNLPGCQAGKCVVGYFPVGPQQNVPIAQLAAWNQCYLDSYGNFNVNLAQLQGMCSGGNLMMACRQNGNQTLQLLAWAGRNDVFFNAGPWNQGQVCQQNRNDRPMHNANGTDWYYDGSWGWGFAAAGDDTNICSCDYISGKHPEQKLCWHTSGGALQSGYRCGSNFPFNDYERLIYQNN